MAAVWSGKRVFVTGAGGFVGGRLCQALVEQGAEVVALVLDQRPHTCLDLTGVADQLTRVYGSLTDDGLLARVIATYEIETVFHLAAQAIVQAASRGPVATLDANIRGTWLLLEACRLVSTVEAVVVASSDKAYGRQPVLPYNETMSLDGLGPYDASKVCTDVLTRMYAGAFGLPATVTRCANIYGPGDLHRSRLVPELCRAVIEGRAPVIRSDGSPTRDYLFIDDAVAGYLALGARSSEEALRGRAFNFGTGQETSVLELVQTVIAVAGADLTPLVQGQAADEIDRQVLDSTAAREVLGWEPRTELADGLRQTVEWTRWLLGRNG